MENGEWIMVNGEWGGLLEIQMRFEWFSLVKKGFEARFEWEWRWMDVPLEGSVFEYLQTRGMVRSLDG